MANEQNLRPVRTKEEARERGRAGGIASGKARREKANLRKLMAMMLEEDIPSGDMTYSEKLTKSMLTIAGSPSFGMASVKAYQTITHMMGMDEPEPDKTEFESDGFIEALKNQAEETLAEAGDIVEE